ncbi:MAG TPA: NYN domain-containing protein [Candidatus Limnocylindrales bacterium]|nr:NYN domain-containing protein [Candidatus Limnocylindrales bacterium]
MPTSRDPLADTERVIVDGSNLLPALARTRGAAPPAALIGRLRAAIPAAIAVELIFDGAPDPGLRGERIAAGVTVRHAGRRTADEAILESIERAGPTFASRNADAILVVTDDRELATGVRARGARTAGTAWLIGRLERPRLASPSVGNRRPPAPPDKDQDEGERAPWKPGRGATVKKGNPRRRRPSSGSMPS